MTREEAIQLGLEMVHKEYGIDVSNALPQFVHIMYDSDDGAICDEDIYPDEEEECCHTDEVETLHAMEAFKNRIASLASEMNMFIGQMTETDEEDVVEEEPRIVRRKRKADPIALVVDEWMVEADDGGFDKYVKVVTEDDEYIVLKLGLLSYDNGREVRVTYLRERDEDGNA